MEIRPVDVSDDAEFHAFHVAAEEAQRHGRPYSSFWSEQQVRSLMRAEPTDQRISGFAAFEGDEVVGTGIIFLPLLDNLDKVYFGIDTRPAYRRRGIGSALLEHVVSFALSEGRSLLLGESFYPLDADDHHPHKRFAAKHGFTIGNEEVRRVLPLPVPDEQIQQWAEESAVHHDGYLIETYVDGIPEPLLASYVQLLNQLAVDAPTGEIDFEAGAVPVEVYLQNAERSRVSGRQTYRTVAVTSGPDGKQEAVAHSALACPPPGSDEPNLYQFGTLVRADHRGHRLGMAVKAANLRAVQKDHPERTIVTTTNSAVNGPMVAINERMGFRPVDVTAEFLRKLD
jgi:GNAT superfamily N-acetyltransferase